MNEEVSKRSLSKDSLQHRTIDFVGPALPAVPYAINSGAKYMIFRPFTFFPLWEDNYSQVIKHADKGYYFKFNCANEIKLVKNTLEDNGFLPQPLVHKQMSTTFQQTHNGESKQTKLGDDWLI